MTALELARLVRDLVPPVGATMAIATAEHTPGPRPGTGTTAYGVAFLVDGRAKSEPIATFGRARDAYALIDLLNGRAPRGPLAPTTRALETRDVPDPAGPGAPSHEAVAETPVGDGWPSLAVADRPTLGLVPEPTESESRALWGDR